MEEWKAWKNGEGEATLQGESRENPREKRKRTRTSRDRTDADIAAAAEGSGSRETAQRTENPPSLHFFRAHCGKEHTGWEHSVPHPDILHRPPEILRVHSHQVPQRNIFEHFRHLCRLYRRGEFKMSSRQDNERSRGQATAARPLSTRVNGSRGDEGAGNDRMFSWTTHHES